MSKLVLASSIFFLIFLNLTAKAQNNKYLKDSIFISEIVKRCGLDEKTELSKNSILISKKKQAKKIAKIFLYSRFGYFSILKQYPMKTAKYNDYWILYGTKRCKKRRGGIYTVVLNSDGCIISLAKGK